MPVTLTVLPGYAAVLVLMYVVLSVRVIRARRRYRVALGQGGQPDLEWRIRAHANFAEYVPIALVVILMAELRGLPLVGVHVLCLCLLAGRLAHAWGVSGPERDFRPRVAGMTLTLVALVSAALWLMWTTIR